MNKTINYLEGKIMDIKTNIYTEIDTIKNISKLEDYLYGLKENWVFRAQGIKQDLSSTLERHCLKSNFNLKKDAPLIEKSLVRQFRRVYDGNDSYKVQEDNLYCLSLMRHYGAPTRLLDFTYSRYVAVYFALEYAYKSSSKDDSFKKKEASIWCINLPSLEDKVKKTFPGIAETIDSRSEDKKRNDKTFEKLYVNNKNDFVCWENPIQLHTRLHLQQGVFLCPSNVKKPFLINLCSPYEEKTKDIIKIPIKLDPKELREGFKKYYRMNLTRESLFPGLDGFADSMNYQFWLYRNLDYWRRRDYRDRG